jgi:hypothetical protein
VPRRSVAHAIYYEFVAEARGAPHAAGTKGGRREGGGVFVLDVVYIVLCFTAVDPASAAGSSGVRVEPRQVAVSTCWGSPDSCVAEGRGRG